MNTFLIACDLFDLDTALCTEQHRTNICLFPCLWWLWKFSAGAKSSPLGNLLGGSSSWDKHLGGGDFTGSLVWSWEVAVNLNVLGSGVLATLTPKKPCLYQWHLTQEQNSQPRRPACWKCITLVGIFILYFPKTEIMSGLQITWSQGASM